MVMVLFTKEFIEVNKPDAQFNSIAHNVFKYSSFKGTATTSVTQPGTNSPEFLAYFENRGSMVISFGTQFCYKQMLTNQYFCISEVLTQTDRPMFIYITTTLWECFH
jgi:hypothetical protein